jgi:hypothetical protein
VPAGTRTASDRPQQEFTQVGGLMAYSLAAMAYSMRALDHASLGDAPGAAQDWQSAAALYLALEDTDHYQPAQEKLSHYAL